MNFEGALELYKKATKLNPLSSEAWVKQGNLLSKLGKDPNQQKVCFKNVLARDSTTRKSLDAYSRLSSIYKTEGVFDSSLMYYRLYTEHPVLPEKRKAAAKAVLPDLEFASNSYLHPIKIDPYPLVDWINEPNSLQYFPVLTGDDKKMLFTRRLKGSQNEDLYISTFLGDWQKPEKLPSSINSSEAEGTATISADGRTIICSYCSNIRET